MEDVKGLQIRSPGGVVTPIIESWGGTPVSMPMSDAYIALEKGIVDAIASPYEVMELIKLGELATFHTEGNFCTNPLGLAMNIDTYKSLPSDIQKIIDETGYEWWVNAGKYNDTVNAEAKRWCLERGNEVITLSPEELETWKQATASVIDKWVTDLEAEGKPARRFVDEAYNCAK